MKTGIAIGILAAIGFAITVLILTVTIIHLIEFFAKHDKGFAKKMMPIALISMSIILTVINVIIAARQIA